MLRLYPNPTEKIILVTKKLPKNCTNDSSDLLKIQKPIVDVNRVGNEFTAALEMMIKKQSPATMTSAASVTTDTTVKNTLAQINNDNCKSIERKSLICFRTFGHENNFEVQKLIQCLINLGGIYDKNHERKDISHYMVIYYYFIFRGMLILTHACALYYYTSDTRGETMSNVFHSSSN